MKNLSISGLLVLLGIFVLASCGGDGTDKSKSNKPTVKNSTKKAEQKKEDTKSTASAKEETADEDAIPTPQEHLDKAESIISSVSKKDIEAVDAKKKFKNLCAICHGTKGNMEINGAKDLTKSKVSLTEAVAQVYHGKGLMTPFKGILSDAEIVAVSKYVEEFRK